MLYKVLFDLIQIENWLYKMLFGFIQLEHRLCTMVFKGIQIEHRLLFEINKNRPRSLHLKVCNACFSINNATVRTLKGCGKIMPVIIVSTQLSPKAGLDTSTILQAKINKYIHYSNGDQMSRMITNKKMPVKEI